jgi:hypothetical protein
MDNAMAETVAERDEATGRFLTGNNGGGRPKGARNKLAEAFIQALADDFETNGVRAIEVVRAEKPDQYLKVIASLLPKEMNLNLNNDLGELSDDELLDEIRKLHASLAPFLAEGAGETASAGIPAQLH